MAQPIACVLSDGSGDSSCALCNYSCKPIRLQQGPRHVRVGSNLLNVTKLTAVLNLSQCHVRTGVVLEYHQRMKRLSDGEIKRPGKARPQLLQRGY